MSKRYPRRFKNSGRDWMRGGYVELIAPGGRLRWVTNDGNDNSSWNSGAGLTEEFAEQAVRDGLWVETFDHHEPELDRLRNDVASLGILKDDAERNYHESAITEARKQERLSCSSELWQEAQRLRRAGMLNDAYEYEQAAKLIAKDDFPKGLTQ